MRLGTKMIELIRFWNQNVEEQGHSMTKYAKNTILGLLMHIHQVISNGNRTLVRV